MGAVNSCCIPRRSGIESNGKSKKGFRHHRRQLSATFNMTLLDEENEAMIKNLMDINEASEEELMTLPGISRVTAKQIIDYRKQIRGFKRIEDLALVSGVGAVRLEAIRNEICVKRTNGSNGSSRNSPESGRNMKENNVLKVFNLNTSNVFQLMKIKGIGQTLAENIVTYRDKKGPFTNLDDLIKVKGVGPHVLSAIKPQLTLDENVTSDSLSCSSSKKSSNHNNSAIPTRNSDISINSVDHSSNPSNEFSKESLENLIDTLGPFSEKPVRQPVDFPTFKCNNRNALRIASWNLEKFSEEKANNPGVKDVVCMTILENGLSIVAVQELADKNALQKICDELNSPTVPNNQKWLGHRGQWNCVVSEDATGRMHMGNEYNGFLYDESQGISVISSCLLAKNKKQKPFTRRPFIATFKIKRFDCALVSVHLKATGLDNEDLNRLQDEIDKIPDLIQAIQEELPGEKDIIILGDFNLSPSTKDFDDIRNHGYHNCISDGVFTNISNANMKGSKTYDNIWIAKQTKAVYTGHSDVIREGLTSPWIPKGWSWGGVVSDHCPVWGQFYTGKDLDSGDLKIGPEAIRFALGNE